MILLTHGYFLEEDPKEKKIMRPYVPLGILYISAYLSQKGVTHRVMDSTFLSYETYCEHLLQLKPSLIGIYTNLMTKLNVLKIIGFVQSHPDLRQCKIILGGPEIRHNARQYLAHGADMLVLGEGEETFYELGEQFLKQGHLSKTVDGTAFISDGELIFNPERKLIKDINTLPMPAREMINLKLYGDAWKQFHGYSMYSMSTMRGCPYTCKWCSRAVYGGTYRRRSPKLVVDEMEYLRKNYQPDRIWFVDDVFTISHKWLKEFRDEVVNRQVLIPYEIITRADRMNEEVISWLKESGCFRIWIGAESGSQKIIDAMDRRVEVKQVRDMIVRARKAGMEAGTFIMLGYPGETREDIKETIEHLKAANPSFYTITLAYPITGTPLYEETKHSTVVPDEWETITDRDLQLKRNYSNKFYLQALKWVHHEMNAFNAPSGVQKMGHKLRSFKAQLLMSLS